MNEKEKLIDAWVSEDMLDQTIKQIHDLYSKHGMSEIPLINNWKITHTVFLKDWVINNIIPLSLWKWIQNKKS